MKILIIVMIASLVGLLSGLKTRQPDACKIVQRHYLHGKLVHEETYNSIVKDHGCLSNYLIDGKNVLADSVVTTLK